MKTAITPSDNYPNIVFGHMAAHEVYLNKCHAAFIEYLNDDGLDAKEKAQKAYAEAWEQLAASWK